MEGGRNETEPRNPSEGKQGGERRLAKLRAGMMLLCQERVHAACPAGVGCPEGIAGSWGRNVFPLTPARGA